MKTLAFAAALVAAAVVTGQARAEWPDDRPIRVLVGFGAGGGTDIVSRIIAQPLSELLHQSVVVENKPGAGGTIAGSDLAKAAKDGYTAGMISTGHTISAVMLKVQPYDAVKDFAPTAMVANSGFVVVARKDFPANDIKSLVALAKASPGKLNFASVGVGSTQQFAGELLAQDTGIKVTHVPYRGTPALVTALLAGQVDYGVELVHAVQGQVQAGQLKLLGVGAPERWPTIPNVPTVAEQGVPGYAVVGWYGWVYPAGTPKPIVDRTAAALKEVLERPAIREQLAKVGAVVHFVGPAQFRKDLEDEIVKWRTVRDKAHIEPK
jgi:tripartite-type tricarboxylate transporter receptor subunit TctC